MFGFRRPVPDDAGMLLRWRTDPEVTRYMFTDIENPDIERQRVWLAGLAGRPDFSHFIMTTGGRDIGYLSYSSIDRHHGHCSSGSYVALPDDRRKLAGLIYPFIMDYCFFTLGMNKLVNYFMAGNENVIRIQRTLRMHEVGVLRQHVFKDGRYHDVHIFEFLREDWEKHRSPFPREVTLAAFAP